MDIVARLKQYIEYLGMPITQFADTAQIPRPTLSQILNGRNKKISNEVISKLHDAFPALNMMWLMFGDGDIESGANTQTSESQNVPISLFGNEFSAYNEDITSDKKPKSPERKPEQTRQNDTHKEENAAPAPIAQEMVAINPDSSKKVEMIMVYYSDKSFEVFKPAQR